MQLQPYSINTSSLPLTAMKTVLYLTLVLLLTFPLLAQTPETSPPVQTYSSDSLVAKRSILTTAILKDNKHLSNADTRSLLQSTPKALLTYRWGKVLRPIGPILIVSSIAVGYLGIKGEQKSDFIRGDRTPTNPYPDDIQVTYIKRSLPKVLAGLGLFVVGFYFIERSNELTATSVRLYNAKAVPARTLLRVEHLNFGITSTGNFGLEAHF
jgi:hypothetical protein